MTVASVCNTVERHCPVTCGNAGAIYNYFAYGGGSAGSNSSGEIAGTDADRFGEPDPFFNCYRLKSKGGKTKASKAPKTG